MQNVRRQRRRQQASSKTPLGPRTRAPARQVLEALETRCLLSVTLDARGWTSVTPSIDSRLIYVSSSTGVDTNSGLSPSSPVASISKAYGLLRSGFPDWLLFKRGDTFVGNFSYFGASGRNSQEPMVVTNYGDPTLARPVIDGTTSVTFRLGNSIHDLDLLGVDFTSSTHDPASPNYTGQGSFGLYGLGGTTNLLVEDCSFRNFIDDVSLQGFYSPLYNVTFRRNEILDAYDNSGGHAEGLYAETVNGLTLDQNFFDHDGWNSNVSGGGATIYNHDAYLHSSDTGVVVTNNVFADASSFGLQARSGGIIDNNLFFNDPYGFSFGLVNGATVTAGGVSGEAVGNVVLGTRADPSGYGDGAMIGNVKVGGGTTISNNIFSGTAANGNPAIQFQPGTGVSNPSQEAGLNSLIVSNNTVYGWGFSLQMSAQYVAGTTGPGGLTAVVIRNNNFQNNGSGRIVSHSNLYDPRYEDWSANAYSSTTASPSSWFTLQGAFTSFASWQANIEPTALSTTEHFVDTTRSIASYMGTQGLTASLSAFVSGIRSQNKSNWNPIYLAAPVDAYVQAGFAVDTQPPTAVAIPPADITPLNYQTTPSPTFTIAFNDNVAIDPTTLSASNVSVTIAGVAGFSLPVALVSTTGSGPSITATYQISAPSNDWTTVPNGTYVISLIGGQVKDTSGNAMSGQPIGSFQVTVNADGNPPAGPATTPLNLAASAGTSSIVLSWSDPFNDQRSYILQRALDSGFTQQVQSFPLTADATAYTDIAVKTGQTYYYQLTAINPLGSSTPTALVNAIILPPAPVLKNVFFNDGNTQRTAIMSATLAYSRPVALTSNSVTLIQNPSGSATPVTVVLTNPSADGVTWIVNWSTTQFNNALPDGSYGLTVHGGAIFDPFGQSAGGDQVYNFASAAGPVVAGVVRGNSAPPHTISFTFNQDVSASLSLTSLKVTNSSKTVMVPASYAWNATTLTGTWTYSGAFADGSYTALLAAAGVTNSDGVHLDANHDGIPGDDYTYLFTQVKPTLTLTGVTNVNINATYTLTVGAINDAGQTSPQYVVNWGDGSSTSPSSTAGPITHSYTAALGPAKISVDVLDANGTHLSAASLSLSVNRATVALTGNANANPAATYTLNVGAVIDTGYAVSQYIVHWGDGTTGTYAPGGAVQHPYAARASALKTAITVDLVDNSGAGGANFTNLTAGTLPVTLNASPSIAMIGDLNANVGGTYRLILGSAASDPGFTVSQLTVNWGDGSVLQNVVPGTTLATHIYLAATAPGTDTIVVDVTDNSGGVYTSAGHLAITVNPAPTVALSGNANANVTGVYMLTLAPAIDVGQNPSSYLINWGDGSSSLEPAVGNYPHIYTLTGNERITVDLTDGTGTFTSAGSLPVVANAAPTLALTGNGAVSAGQAYTLTISPNDAGGMPQQYIVHWGDGSVAQYTSANSILHTFATAQQVSITADLVDTTGTFLNAGTLSVLVDPAPTVLLSGTSNTNVGVPYSLTLGAVNDQAGTVTSYIVHWGDGQSDTYSSGGAVSHPYTSVGSALIVVDLVDQNGPNYSCGSMPVIINQPSIALAGKSGAAGQPYKLLLGSIFDPGQTVYQFTVNWGDGLSDIYSSATAAYHTYASPGNDRITVDLADRLGSYPAAAALSVTVNGPPSMNLAGSPSATVGGTYALAIAAPADQNGPPTKYVVNWGDGSTTTAASAGSLTHFYATPGTDTISLNVTDPVTTWTNVSTLGVTVTAPAAMAKIVGRNTFYNDSKFTNYASVPAPVDFQAIATDKRALLPGQTASFQNFTSYSKGINGIIVDITGLPPGKTLTAADFSFGVGNTSTISTWPAGPVPTGISVFGGAGAGGSDRVVITFADFSIVGKWLKVTVLATANTGLASADVFYFGNSPGNTGTNTTSAIVSNADIASTRWHLSHHPLQVPITNPWDFNRDGYANKSDLLIVKSDVTNAGTMLQLIMPS